MKDVADLAGVSKATVSNTLNRPWLVMPATQERVMAAIQRLGFIADQNARRLSGAASQVIGVVVIDATNPFFTEAARAIEDVAVADGCVMILCNSDGSQEKEEHFLRVLAGQRVKGVLLSPSTGREYEEVLNHGRDVPIVYLDHASATGCSVSVDDVFGGELAMRHLIERGAVNIAFVGGSDEIRQHAHRYTGARQVAAEGRGRSRRRLTRVLTDGINLSAGARAVERLLDDRARPDALFCANDMIAFGAYRALAAADLRVPEDIMLVGYDDIEFAKDWIVPLTSVRQPTRELGTVAAQLLLEHSTGDDTHDHRSVVLSPELVVRQSTGGGPAG